VNALLEQTPALVGVAVGALLSFVLSTFAERTRWRRDEAVRWDAERMRIYADYGLTVRDMYRVVLSVASHHGYGDQPAQPDRPPDADAALTAAEAQRAARFEAVLLVGNPTTIAAARPLAPGGLASGVLRPRLAHRPRRMAAGQTRVRPRQGRVLPGRPPRPRHHRRPPPHRHPGLAAVAAPGQGRTVTPVEPGCETRRAAQPAGWSSTARRAGTCPPPRLSRFGDAARLASWHRVGRVLPLGPVGRRRGAHLPRWCGAS
jgi:hypothetical protein